MVVFKAETEEELANRGIGGTGNETGNRRISQRFGFAGIS